MNKDSNDKNISLTGVMMTVMVTIALVWAGLQWKHRYNWPRPITDKERQANSMEAFKNLQLICAAQEKYKQKDWDNDGQKVYSRYLAHLWTTLNQQSDPIRIKLIPQNLAFAMGPKRSVEGYYYSDLPEREVDLEGNTRKNDYAKEWAIVAIDATGSPTANSIFLADNSGKILMKYTDEYPTKWPYDPHASGWKIVTDSEQITRKR
ncbi:MAG: hypothetical protein ABFR90_03990 [Planctomycetota bacterium]